MKNLTEVLNEILEKAFIKAGFGTGFGQVILSARPDLAEYQCNSCMALAKKVHKKPIEIAEIVVNVILEDPDLSWAFAKVTSSLPGFINMDLSSELILRQIYEMSKSTDAGLKKDTKPKKIIVDYGGPNVAKPLHVGHLRSAVIGEAIKRMGKAFGNEMIGDIHLGDWGMQIGLIYAEVKDRGLKDFDLNDLEEIYPAASSRSDETDEDGNPTKDALDFRNRALLATHALQNGDPEVVSVWKKIMALSVPDLKKNYDSLDVHFELWKGESDVQKYIPDMINSFLEKGLAYESQGALVVDISEEGDPKELPPCLVRKSDGSALYATTDLATLVEREKLFNPDGYIYIADKRQSLHYTSFFRVAKKAGIVDPKKLLCFLGFGTINGEDGKPLKTREGGTMHLENLINEIDEAAYQKVRASRKGEDITDEEARDISKIVGLAALKYGDLSNQASKDYIFDPDRFTNFDGKTGAYILYTIVRIGGILKKSATELSIKNNAEKSEAIDDKAVRNVDSCGDKEIKRETETFDLNKTAFKEPSKKEITYLKKAIEDTPTLKVLSMVLLRYPESALISWEQLSPHKLCQYIYELSDAFNTFYHEVKVIQEEDENLKNTYIFILTLTRRVLLDSIHMLGFSAPDRM